MKNSFLLDTSAVFAFTDDEEGANEVQKLLTQAGHDKANVFISAMSMMEAYYIAFQETGETDADRLILLLRSLPLKVLNLSEDLILIAGSLKGRYQISVADAWIAATAKFHNLVVVHKDPEFEPLKHELDLIELPYKATKKPQLRSKRR
ncbi:PIN domain-containing protein [bacterium]|nr:PIN domain-containing protein [bacterium]